MKSKLIRIIINVVLVIIIICFIWPFNTPRQGILIKSIGAPISFKNEKDKREGQIIQRLMDIRNAEILYKQEFNKYTSNFDTLVDFCTNFEIPIVKVTVDSTDLDYFKENNDYRTYSDTTGHILVCDSMYNLYVERCKRAGIWYKERNNYDIKDLGIVPFSDPVSSFEIHDSIIKKGGINVPVFEAKTPFEVYLAKPGERFSETEWNTRVKNAKAELEQLEKYAGLKVGSLEEPSTDGNWEKL